MILNWFYDWSGDGSYRAGHSLSSQSDQNPRCPHEETLGPCLPIAKFRQEKPRRNKSFLFFSAKKFILRNTK